MGKSKKQEYKSPQFEINLNRNFSSRGKIYRRPDRQRFNDVYVRKQEYRPTYSRDYPRFKPYSSSNEPYFKKKMNRRPPSRPSSPVLGSEEYMDRKIQQTSAIIMKHLLNPDEHIVEHSESQASGDDKKDRNEETDINAKKTVERPTEATENKRKNNIASYNIEEIHKKIINHITNLNDGKKKNLVFSKSSSYDFAIRQIQKQKRLEISQALRNMCSQSEVQESSDFINSIIPDMGIKIEDLPRSVIEELSNTLNFNCENINFEDDMFNYPSQDTGYYSLGESQSYEGNMYSGYSSCGDEISYLHPFVKQEQYVQEPPAIYSMNDDSAVVSNEYNIENIVIKKENDQHSENHTSCKVANDAPDSSPPNNSKEIREITENIVKIKQEIVDQYQENENSNTGVLDENRALELDADKIGVEDMELEDDSSINEEDKNTAIETVKGVINIANDKLCNLYNQERESNFNSVQRTIDVSTQTDVNSVCPTEMFIETFLEASNFKQPPKSIPDAINRMLRIDKCILKLTKYRQTLFNNFKKSSESVLKTGPEKKSKKKNKGKKKLLGSNQEQNVCNAKGKETVDVENGVMEKKRCEDIPKSLIANNGNNFHADDVERADNMTSIESSSYDATSRVSCQNLLKLPEVYEKMLVIKAVKDKLVAATESGKMFIYSLEDGHCTNTLHISDMPITALWYEERNQQNMDMYIGSFENRLKVYDFSSQTLLRSVSIEDSIQCLESKWGFLFMGCTEGTVVRYSIKKCVVEYEDKWSDDRILVIKATHEGARRVLLVGSRNSPVCIRDAMTGLYLRTLENIISPTVYSLIIAKNLIYCGTTNHDILVNCFHDGKLVNTYKGTSMKGISCLKLMKGLLFASCHDGNIYVYDVKRNRFIDSIQGPGGVILSMEVLENQVIVGTMSFKFASLPIPEHILMF